MRGDYWRTYDGGQASQIASAVQYLLDGDVLGGEEQRVARSIQAKLRNAITKGGEMSMMPFNKEEDELLNQVEATLWK